MSPSTLRAARLASRQALWAPLRQQRALSSTPARLSARTSHQRADWGRMVKERAGSLAIYVPFMTIVLGWPMVARGLFDGRM
ncbi:hypothetical protein GGR57DRAFT_469227 [Xylariaceae sp. FL1272]|nr:hypothetical protein GGR57DRAFT_469227 [Xylariaceae sp. FL1272]